MQLIEFVTEEEDEKPHLDKALDECGDGCHAEFEDEYNIWDWHKGCG